MNIEHWVHLRWVKDSRYYEVRLHQDLWVLTKMWGRRGTALGQLQHVPCATRDEGREVLNGVAERRKQRGYRLVAGMPEPESSKE